MFSHSLDQPGRFSRLRPRLAVEWLALVAVLWVLVIDNQAFWRGALQDRVWADASTWRFAAAVLTAFAAFYAGVLGLLLWGAMARPLLHLVLLTAAVCSYFTDRYGVYLDPGMLRNVLATDTREAAELLTWALLWHVVTHALPPMLLVAWARPNEVSWRRLLWRRALMVAGGLLIGVLCLLLVFADFASLMRNHKELRHLLNPGNSINALLVVALERPRRADAPLTPVGVDAKLGSTWAQSPRPVWVVLVVGETARAQNFSLNGYGRPTNPQLAARDVVSMADVTACGTSTEVSLPCMFSAIGRRDYDAKRIQSHESLLHVVARAGLSVEWVDNQSGCKGVCKGLKASVPHPEASPDLCAKGHCFDEALLQGWNERVPQSGGALTVMHQLGSHGPSYYKRYPAPMAKFQPACLHDDLRRCSQAEIVNAYDNSLLYTDHLLAQIIDRLKALEASHDTALIYVSDHGESLGEAGLYLHGVPYAIAPDVQKKVPMVLWLSRGMQARRGVSHACLQEQRAKPLSHDNLFHSVLGLMDVQTQAREADLDFFATCRSPRTP